MKRYVLLAVAVCMAPVIHAQSGVGAPTTVKVTPFVFQVSASRNPAFDRSPYQFPAKHARAGQVNENVGDVRLDAISVNGTTYAQSQLQFFGSAQIVIDDAVDTERGGGNFAAGHGIGANRDSWVGEGVATTTPTAKDIVANHGNFNLTSIVATREGAGTAIFEVTFPAPTDTLFIFERGGSGDLLVSALNRDGRVLGSYKLRDGVNDGSLPADYTRTGITVTTYVQESFQNQGQELVSVGLRFSEPVSRFRFTSFQEPEGEGATRFNGPDLKILGLRPGG